MTTTQTICATIAGTALLFFGTVMLTVHLFTSRGYTFRLANPLLVAVERTNHAAP